MRGVRGGDLQGIDRVSGMYQLRQRQVFGDDERDVGERVRGVPRQLILGVSECHGRGVPMQCRLQRARRRAMRGVRGGQAQGSVRISRVHELRARQVLKYDGGDDGEHVHCVCIWRHVTLRQQYIG